MYATIVATHVGNLEYFSIHQYSRNYVANDKHSVLYLIAAVQILHVVECDHWVATSHSGGVVNL